MGEGIAIAAKILVLIISVILYANLFSKIIPTFIMKMSFKRKKVTTCDRGLKKFVYPNGRCVLYEPELSARQYVNKYALYTEGGYKYIRCKVAQGVGNLWYDVYAFDNRNKLIDIVWVAEELGLSRYTAAVALPPETSYVRFVLRQADNESFQKGEILADYSKVRYVICAVLAALATMIESVIIYIIALDFILPIYRYIAEFYEEVIVYLCENFFGATPLYTPSGTLFSIILNPLLMLLAIVGISAIVTVLTILAYRRNSKKVINR